MGDVVLEHQENTSRSSWNVGVMKKLIEGRDEKARGAQVKTISKEKPVYIDKPV